MLESRLSRILLLLGAGVGTAGVVVWALELQMNLPDWVVRVAMLKLTLIASAGLLAGGALVGRHAHQRAVQGAAGAGQLGEDAADSLAAPPQKAATPQGVDRRHIDKPL